jgi:hypothetical protein
MPPVGSVAPEGLIWRLVIVVTVTLAEPLIAADTLVAVIWNVPALVPAVNSPPASIVPPVAVQVAPMATELPSLSVPVAVNWTWPLAATVALPGETTTPVIEGCGDTTVTVAVSERWPYAYVLPFPLPVPITLKLPVVLEE